MRRNNRNSLPFIILFFIHTFLLGFTFYKNKNKKNIFVLLVANMGFAYLLEYFVLNLFKAYTYKPKVLKNHFLDNVFGAVLSQAIFIPFTAVFLTIFKSGWTAKVIGSIYFSFIELLFLQLRVYNHTWWKTVYTFTLLPFYFKWSDSWYNNIMKENSIVRFVSYFLMVMVTETNLLLILAIFRKFRFGIGRIHSWREHFILSPLYTITLSIFTSFSLKKDNNMGAKLRVILFAACLQYFFERKKLIKNNLQFIEFLLVRIVMVFIYGKYRKWVYGEKVESG